MRDHRSLEAWREAKELARFGLWISRHHWKPYSSVLLGQLQRAALSIQLNIAEGYALRGQARFANHLNIAYGSAIETAELLDHVKDEKLVPLEMVEAALVHCHRCERLLLGLIKRYRQV